jgi:hypothetical protein
MAHGAVKTKPDTAEQVRQLLRAGKLREAVCFAARFPQLGKQRDRILSAREAFNRPEFQRELGRDPEALIRDGVEALREKYGA